MSSHLENWRKSCAAHGLKSCRKSHPKYAAVRRTYEQHKGSGFFSNIASSVGKDLLKKGVSLAAEKGAPALAGLINGKIGSGRKRGPKRGKGLFSDLLF